VLVYLVGEVVIWTLVPVWRAGQNTGGPCKTWQMVNRRLARKTALLVLVSGNRGSNHAVVSEVTC